MNTLQVSAVIPAFNEAATIADVVAGARRYCRNVIVVDDGSSDQTAERVSGLEVTLIRHERNRGKAESLWTGMQAALNEGADAVITLDGDGQHAPEDIPRVVEAATRHPGCLVIAARLNHREDVPKARRFANVMADFWISWAAGWRIRDTQSGFRLYPAKLLSNSKARHTAKRGFVFESEILIDAVRQGFRPKCVAIDARYGTSARHSYYRPWHDTLMIIAMVAGKLLRWGMYPTGLMRSQGLIGTAEACETHRL